MTLLRPPSITFDLSGDAAAIVKRAAVALNLRVLDGTGRSNGTFRVELRESLDAFRLGHRTVCDPAWARLLMEKR